MPVLWGCWSADTFKPDQNKINGLNQAHVWKHAVINELSGDFFCGALIHDDSQHFDGRDHYYTDVQNTFSVIISGTIYNIKELAIIYNLPTLDLSTSELILNLYSQYGDTFYNDLNGDFCLVIMDKSNNSIELVRDHLGIHPCSFYYLDQHLYFSTDSLALSKVFQENDPVNCQYILNQMDTAHEWDYRSLPNRKVQRLLPGHQLKIENGILAVRKYWEPEKIKINRKQTFEEIIDNFRTILQDAVKIRAVPHCKSAVHLSGGLDSGFVAALARQEYKDQPVFHGYSWSQPARYETSDLSEEVNRVKAQSNYLNIEPQYQALTLEEYLNYLSEWRFELYIYHELKVLEVAEKYAEKLIFSGWGGDEFISKNSDGLDSDLIFGFQWNSFLKKYSIRYPRRLLSALYHGVFSPLFGHTPQRQSSVLEFYSRYIHSDKCPPFGHRINLTKWKSRRDVHINLLYNYHLAARTESLFTFGIRHGVSYRFPLLDKRIIENILTVPSRFMFKGKYVRIMLRVLSEDLLPKELIWINQKNEPALYETDKELRKSAAEEIIKELEEYKKLPELEVFNFDQLEKDIDLCKKDKFTYDSDLLCLFLVDLKKRYEFVKGYKALNTQLE